MALAWIVLAGITTAMSRYYKDWFGERLLLGTKVWFQVGRPSVLLKETTSASRKLSRKLFLSNT